MNILLVMLPLSILLLIAAGVAFFWAVDHDQFDDMDTPALLPMSDALPTAETTEDSIASTASASPPTTADRPPDC